VIAYTPGLALNRLHRAYGLVIDSAHVYPDPLRRDRVRQHRARAAGIKTKIGNHSLRATGITDYLKNNGTLEHAQAMANHSSPRTAKLCDRRADEISIDEVERIGI